jgi:leucyl aminopeptidase (aminopeptidase T)
MNDRNTEATQRIAQLGASNLVQRCLGVRRGEAVAFMTHGADPSFACVRAALLDAGASVQALELDRVEPQQVESSVSALLARCSASIVMGAPLPMEHHHAILRVVEPSSVRHTHIVTADLRVLSTSCRADPSTIERINQHIVEGLEASGRLRCDSPAGTAIDVRLGNYPILAGSGRAKPGYWDNVPSGVVYFHPLAVTGVFVADRGLQISGVQIDDRRAKRNPLTVTLAAGRVAKHHSADAELSELFADFLAKHPDAGRVGMVSVSTNYLARVEIGHRAHDGLLPGMRLQLGWSNARFTRAPFDAPVSCRLTGRRQSVSCGEPQWVHDGRFVGRLAEMTALGASE